MPADDRPFPPLNHRVGALVVGMLVGYGVSILADTDRFSLPVLSDTVAGQAYSAWWRRQQTRASPDPKAHTPNL